MAPVLSKRSASKDAMSEAAGRVEWLQRKDSFLARLMFESEHERFNQLIKSNPHYLNVLAHYPSLPPPGNFPDSHQSKPTKHQNGLKLNLIPINRSLEAWP